MKKLITWCSFLFFSFASAQPTNTLSPGAKLLFQNVKTKLTVAEKNEVFAKTGFLLSADKKQFIADKSAADFPFEAMVYPTDLNGDGKEEIFVSFGNTYTSGNTGSSVLAFIKNDAGKYASQFGFPGLGPYAIVTGAKGYPDMIITGPGFTFPVWRWNGKQYTFNRKISDATMQKTKTAMIEDVSKQYTAGIK